MTNLSDDDLHSLDDEPPRLDHDLHRYDDTQGKPFFIRALRALRRVFRKDAATAQERNDRLIGQWMSVLGGLTFVFLVTSIVTTCTIADQLHEMKAQMKAQMSAMQSLSEQAARNVEASSSANNKIADTAKSTLVDVQRAFVIVDKLKSMPTTDTQKNETVWYYAPVMKNGGNTPALNLKYIVLDPHSDAMLRPLALSRQAGDSQYYEISARIGAPQDPDDVLAAAEASSTPYIIKSGAVGSKNEVPISNAFSDIHTASNETTNPDAMIDRIGRFIFGSIRYEDVFGGQHLTKFCFEVGGTNPNDGAPMLPHRCRHWNCSDQEECDKDKIEYSTEFEEARVHPTLTLE